MRTMVRSIASVLQILFRPLQALGLFSIVVASSGWIVLFGGDSLAGYTPSLSARLLATLRSDTSQRAYGSVRRPARHSAQWTPTRLAVNSQG